MCKGPSEEHSAEEKALSENNLGMFRQRGAGCHNGQAVKDADVRDGQGMLRDLS